MSFSNAVLLSLETNPLMRLYFFETKNPVKISPATRKRKSEFFVMKQKLEDPDAFFEYMRVTRRVFEYIFKNVKAELQGQLVTVKTITPREKLALTLRVLVAGKSLAKMAIAFCMGRSTACNVVMTTLQLLWDKFSGTHMRQPTPAEIPRLVDEYYTKWKFPNCVGALKGKYVMLTKKKKNITKKNKIRSSVVLSAVADANSRLLCVDVSKVADDGNIFTSIFAQCGSRTLPNTTFNLPYVLISDIGFPLKNHILRPFPGKSLAPEKTEFNEWIKEATFPVDVALEVITQKFKLLSNLMIFNESRSQLAIKVCCLIYNIAKDIDEENDLDLIKAKSYGRDINTSMVKKQGRKNRSSDFAINLREKFKNYYKEEHSKPMDCDDND